MNKLTLSELSQRLKEVRKTLILTHRNPDPDTLGSAFALKCIIEKLGADADVACCDKIPEKFGFITRGASTEYCNKTEYERIIAVDVASPSQLGDLAFLSGKVDITIDHHEMNERFSDYYEDMGAACCEIFMQLADALKITDDLERHFFECVYAGISGDTGCFKYSNTSPRTLEYAARILAKGINHAEINRIIFDSHTMKEITAQRIAYENMKFFCEGTLAIILFTNRMKEENGIDDSDLSDLVNYIRAIEGVKIAVSLKQSGKDETKYFVSARANYDTDVSEVCAKIGGGGHYRAAGATIIASDGQEALEKCIELFSEALENE